MRRLGDEEIRAFLTAGTRTGKLAVTRLDGSPMVVPIWFAVDDDGTLLFTTWARASRASRCAATGACRCAWTRSSRPTPTCASTASRRSRTTRSSCAPGRRASAARYMGAERAEQYGERNGVPGELLVRITPTRIVAQADIAD